MIITRDRLACLERSVAATLADPATSELVIVDAGSIDGTWNWVGAQLERDGRVKRVRLAGAGPNAARQHGVERSSGDVVVLLDDDVEPGQSLVTGYVEALAGHPRRVVSGYLPIAAPARRTAGDVAAVAYARDYERRCERYDRGEPVLAHLWGGNFGLWRAAALEVGLSAPGAAAEPAFYEDREFGLRAARAGLEGVFRRDLAATHRYSRQPARAIDDALRRGHGGVALHALHHDVLGPFDGRSATKGLPRPIAGLLRAAVRLGVDRQLRALLIGAVELTGRLRRWSAQDALFKLTRRLAELRGVHDALEPA